MSDFQEKQIQKTIEQNKEKLAYIDDVAKKMYIHSDNPFLKERARECYGYAETLWNARQEFIKTL